MEIVHRLLDRVLFGTAVAPREAGAVVGADAREWRDFLLDQRPLDGEAAAAALGDDAGCTRADAADMQPAAADVDELARRRWRRRGVLREQRGGERREQNRTEQVSHWCLPNWWPMRAPTANPVAAPSTPHPTTVPVHGRVASLVAQNWVPA